MEVDFGGIAKEYAVDRAAAEARRLWPSLLLNFGGDLLAVGEAPAGGWRVGIEGGTETGATLRLARGALATSGDTHRYLERDGRRYGHILDPRTGWPVEKAPRSVTVCAPSCTHAGALATLAMLSGKRAEKFLDDQGVDYWCLR